MVLSLLAGAAHAQPADYVKFDDTRAAYCLGVHQQIAARLQSVLAWRCGPIDSMEWCRDTQTSALRAGTDNDRLIAKLIDYIADNGLTSTSRSAGYRQNVMQSVVNGAIDVALCYHPAGEKLAYQHACDQIKKICSDLRFLDK